MNSSLKFKTFVILGLLTIFLHFSLTPIQAQGSLMFEPSSLTVNKAELFDVDINVDTFGSKTGGVGAKIKFDPTQINIISVIPGIIFADYPSAVFDNSAGTAILSGIVGSPEDLFSGTGVFAKLKILPVSAGTTTLSFEFTPGSTTDSNIAITTEPWDILTEVNSLTVTINETGKVLQVTPPINSNTTGTNQPAQVLKEPGFFQKILAWLNIFSKDKNTSSEIDPYAPITRQEPNSNPNVNLSPVAVSGTQTLNYTTLSYVMIAIVIITILVLLGNLIKKKIKKSNDDQPPTIINEPDSQVQT